MAVSKLRVAAATTILAVIVKRRKQKKRKRSVWVKPWLERRATVVVYGSLLQELRREEIESFNNYLRMSLDNFEELFHLIEADITK